MGGMDGWQPIDTAPKDGTWMLTCRQNDTDSVRIAQWRAEGWCDDGDGYTIDERHWPTHWMPMPDPHI